jgi:hypothetical protein
MLSRRLNRSIVALPLGELNNYEEATTTTKNMDAQSQNGWPNRCPWSRAMSSVTKAWIGGGRKSWRAPTIMPGRP